jgi:acylphosphatase
MAGAFALVTGACALDSEDPSGVAIQAVSSVGGQITRSEVLARAQYWVDQNIVYGTAFDSNGNVTSTRTAPDSTGRRYRTDCSGLVSLAWHLSASYTTFDFHSGVANVVRLSSSSQLQPGDAVLFSGHIELFAAWKNASDHTGGAWSYSLNGPVDHDWAKGPSPNSHGQRGELSWSDITNNILLHYNNVIADPAPPPPDGPAVASNADGRLEVFIHGTDNALWHTSQVTPGGSFTGWSSLGGGLTSAPAVASNADGRLEVFVRGTDNAVWHTSQVTPGGSFAGWSSLGGGSSSAPAVARNADGRLEVFIQGTDNALWHAWQATAGGSFTAWRSLGGGVSASPAVASNADGRLEVFIHGTDNALWHAWQATAGGSFTAWSSLGGGVSAAPAVASNADGRLEVFIHGTDNALWHTWQTTAGGSFTAWSSLGGGLR